MKVVIHENFNGEEYVEFNVHKLPPGFLDMIARIQCVGQSILVRTDAGKMINILIEDIYYLETVDDIVYVYMESGMPHSIRNQRLSELENKFDDWGFTRVSKKSLVHLNKIQSFVPAGNGRQRAIMDNGENILISRQYVSSVVRRLNG